MAKIDRVITNTQTSLRPSVGGLTPDAQAGNAAQAQRLAALGQLPATPGGSQATSKAPNLLETLQLDDQQRQFSTAAPQQTPSQASIDLLQTGLTGPQLDFTIGGDRGVRVEGGQIVGGPRLDSTGKVEIANRAVQKQFEPIEQQLRESQAGETASNRAALAKLGVLPGAVKGASASTQRLKDVEQQQFRETDELGRAKQRAFDAVTSNIASREASIAQGLLEQAKARIASGVEEFKGQISLLQDIVQREEVVRKAEQLDARENIRILAEGGKFSLQNLSDEELNELSQSTGWSPFILNAFVDANKPKGEQIDWKRTQVETPDGLLEIWSGIDPITGKLVQQTQNIPLPEGVNLTEFDPPNIGSDGRLYYVNPKAQEVFVYGEEGQFGGQEAQKPISVSEGTVVINPTTGEIIFENERKIDPVDKSQQSTVNLEDGVYRVTYDVAGNIINKVKIGEAQEKQPSQGQSRAAGFATRMEHSHKILNELEELASKNTGIISQNLPSIFKDSDLQRLEQAQRNFVNAQLRLESGAVIAQEEFDNARKQYFPQPGDEPAVIEQKRENRRDALRSMVAEAGPAYIESSLSGSSVTSEVDVRSSLPDQASRQTYDALKEVGWTDEMIIEGFEGDTKKKVNFDFKSVELGSNLARKNNNPGNLRFNNQAGASPGFGGFARFDTPMMGVIALANDLLAKFGGTSTATAARLGRSAKTLLEVIEVFAPKEDGNDPVSYADFVAKRLGVKRNEPVQNLVGRIDELVKAFALKESSSKIT